MHNCDSNNYSDSLNQSANLFGENVASDEDLIMEQILENINTTHIGQVLKKIALLPEGRKEKILDLRQQLTHNQYSINDRLDVALDKVLEELTT